LLERRDRRSPPMTKPRSRLLIALAAVLTVLGACGEHADVRKGARSRVSAAGLPFAHARVWSHPLAADAPLDARSDALVATLLASVREQIARGSGPALSTAARAPIYRVAADVPRVPVALDSGPWAGAVRRQLARGVPIPADALPSRGSDAAMVIWQPASDTMWEFFLAQQALHAPLWLGQATVAGGGSLPPGSYRYTVTALNANGETTAARPALTKQITGAGARITIRWGPIDGATGYGIYRASGGDGPRRLATVPADTTAYTDTGARDPGARAAPTTNTATTPGHWRAANAGALHDVSTNPGHYRDIRKPNGRFLERFNWGPSATSLPLAAGMITKADLRRGHIDHALALGLPNLTPESSIIASGRWAFPAQRADGKSTRPDAIPEGARFRLDPTLDLDELHLSPLVRMLADAAQRYGMIVQDGAPATVIYGEDPTPYIRAGRPNFYDAVTRRRPTDLLAQFPWQHLTLLAMTICTNPTEPCTRR
jgi:hypothetical protein